MKRTLAFLTILFLVLVLTTGCGGQTSEQTETETETTEEIVEDNTKDLAQYLRQDFNTAVQEIGGLHLINDTDSSITYANDDDSLEVEGTKKSDGTTVVSKIDINGPCNYNLFGIKRGMESSEAHSLIEETCEDVEDVGETTVTGKVPLEQSDNHNILSYTIDTDNHSVKTVMYYSA